MSLVMRALIALPAQLHSPRLCEALPILVSSCLLGLTPFQKPHNTRWLTPAELRLAQVRLAEDAGEADEDGVHETWAAAIYNTCLISDFIA